MGKYGRGMRDCCDSPAQQGQPHIKGCAEQPHERDIVERLLFDARYVEQFSITVPKNMRAAAAEITRLREEARNVEVSEERVAKFNEGDPLFDEMLRRGVAFLQALAAWDGAEFSAAHLDQQGKLGIARAYMQAQATKEAALAPQTELSEGEAR